jgi:Domain of unknown function (DUF1707)
MDRTHDARRLPPLRASDAERDQVVAELSKHYQAGRLSTDELEERTGRALTARTLDDLSDLTADLPGEAAGGPAPVGGPVLARLPVLAALLVVPVVIAAVIVVSAATGHHGWDGLWLLFAIPLIARRIATRGDWRRAAGSGGYSRIGRLRDDSPESVQNQPW